MAEKGKQEYGYLHQEVGSEGLSQYYGQDSLDNVTGQGGCRSPFTPKAEDVRCSGVVGTGTAWVGKPCKFADHDGARQRAEQIGTNSNK